MLTAFCDTIMRFGKKEKKKVEGWKKQLMIFNMPSLPRQKAQTCIMVVWEPERDPREPSQKKRRSDDMRWHPAHLPSGLVSNPCERLSPRPISTFQGTYETSGSPGWSSPLPAAGILRLLVAAAGGLILAANDYHINPGRRAMAW
jgi:hypothetical protein